MKAGEEFRTRPMTAGAGYSSSTSNTVKQKLEVYQRTKSVFEIIRDTEKEIHSLIEESSAMFEHSEISLALEKAKQAATLEKKLIEQRELND